MNFIVQNIKAIWYWLVSKIRNFRKQPIVHIHTFSRESIDKIQKQIEEHQQAHKFDIQDVEVVSVQFDNITYDKTTTSHEIK